MTKRRPARSFSQADLDTIEHAAAELDGEAFALRATHTVPPRHVDWTGEAAALREYRRLQALRDALYDIAKRLRAQHGRTA